MPMIPEGPDVPNSTFTFRQSVMYKSQVIRPQPIAISRVQPDNVAATEKFLTLSSGTYITSRLLSPKG